MILKWQRFQNDSSELTITNGFPIEIYEGKITKISIRICINKNTFQVQLRTFNLNHLKVTPSQGSLDQINTSINTFSGGTEMLHWENMR